MSARQRQPPRTIFSLIKSISSALCDPECQRDSAGVWGIFVVFFFLQVFCLHKSIFTSESSTEPSVFILAAGWFGKCSEVVREQESRVLKFWRRYLLEYGQNPVIMASTGSIAEQPIKHK